MKRIAYRLLAVISVLGALGMVDASTRPHYGGTLRVELEAPARPGASADELAAIAPWIFDGLARLNSRGNIEPALAASWEHDSGGSRWTFKLRSGVKWHDGSALRADQVAAALAGCRSGGRIAATSDSVEFGLETPSDTLPMLLASSPACLVRRPSAPGAAEGVTGTGAFRLGDWQPGRRAVLEANDDYWGGRPYLDRVEVQLNRSSRDALLDLELDRADAVELDPPEARRAHQENNSVWASAPSELLAIQFSAGHARPEERDLRQALSLSLDRTAIQKALLQNYGEATASLFPSWVSGYAFLFPALADLAQARKLASPPGRLPSWKLGYNSSDALSRIVAERVVLNAREAGLELQVVALDAGAAHPGEDADARLVRYRIEGPTLERAVEEAAETLGFPPPRDSQPEKVYEGEKGFLESGAVIPIAYIPELFGLSSRVRPSVQGSPARWGGLDLAEVWVAPSEP
jgi:peptide/nickel transport system substrate-binding protein